MTHIRLSFISFLRSGSHLYSFVDLVHNGGWKKMIHLDQSVSIVVKLDKELDWIQIWILGCLWDFVIKRFLEKGICWVLK